MKQFIIVILSPGVSEKRVEEISSGYKFAQLLEDVSFLFVVKVTTENAVDVTKKFQQLPEVLSTREVYVFSSMAES